MKNAEAFKHLYRPKNFPFIIFFSSSEEEKKEIFFNMHAGNKRPKFSRKNESSVNF